MQSHSATSPVHLREDLGPGSRDDAGARCATRAGIRGLHRSRPDSSLVGAPPTHHLRRPDGCASRRDLALCATERGGKREFAFTGRYRDIVPPRRMVYTFEYEGTPGHPVQDTVMLVEHAGRTTLAITSRFQSAEDCAAYLSAGMQSGSTESLGWSRRTGRAAEERPASVAGSRTEVQFTPGTTSSRSIDFPRRSTVTRTFSPGLRCAGSVAPRRAWSTSCH